MNTGVVLAVAMAMAAPVAAGAQTSIRPTLDQQRRIDKIFVMEGTLTSSVKLAAKQVSDEVRSVNPSATLFSGDARAKGFTLDGYGVFFFVEIPALDLSVMLTVETFEREAQRRLDAQVSPRVESQQVSNPRQDAPQQTTLPSGALPSLALPSSAKDMLRSVTDGDPGQKYRDAVKLHLIDAMLDNSKNLALQPDEWLSVAARGSEAGLLTNEILQLRTVVLRVKGSDLADFLAGRLTQEEARLKVEVRQF